MKHTFLLDESFIGALTAGTPGAEEIMFLIMKNCHKVVISADLVTRYWGLRSRIERRGKMRNDPAYYLNLVSRNAAKRDDRENPDTVSEERALHDQNDTFLLRYASRGGAIVILEDTQTREDINRVGQIHGVRAVTIDQAIPLASER